MPLSLALVVTFAWSHSLSVPSFPCPPSPGQMARTPRSRPDPFGPSPTSAVQACRRGCWAGARPVFLQLPSLLLLPSAQLSPAGKAASVPRGEGAGTALALPLVSGMVSLPRGLQGWCLSAHLSQGHSPPTPQGPLQTVGRVQGASEVGGPRNSGGGRAAVGPAIPPAFSLQPPGPHHRAFIPGTPGAARLPPVLKVAILSSGMFLRPCSWHRPIQQAGLCQDPTPGPLRSVFPRPSGSPLPSPPLPLPCCHFRHGSACRPTIRGIA